MQDNVEAPVREIERGCVPRNDLHSRRDIASGRLDAVTQEFVAGAILRTDAPPDEIEKVMSIAASDLQRLEAGHRPAAEQCAQQHGNGFLALLAESHVYRQQRIV